MHHHSGKALRDLYLKGDLSCLQIAENVLKRIGEHDQKTRAFLSVFSDRVLERARSIDAKKKSGKPLGKLAGIPIALKDNIHLKGELTTCASRFLVNYRAVFDATVAHLLEQEDALIIGKTNLDEFAMGSSTENSAFHPTKNPWNLNCSPGGSSGGSAAAVAARLVPIALGSDTGGSIRQPAAMCGIVGFKPTYGRVSRYGLVAFASSLDQIGPLTTNVEDTALIMEVIGRHCPNDATSLNIPSEAYTQKMAHLKPGMKVGVPREFLETLDPETKQNFEHSLEILKQLGMNIVDVNLSLLKYSIAIYYILATAEASTNLARFDGIRYGKRSSHATTLDEVYDLSKQEGFGPEVKSRILLGTYVLSAGYQDAYYKKAQKVRTLIIEQFHKAFQMCDLIASPTSPIAAFPLGALNDPLQMYLQDIYTIGANLAGLPAISVPSGFNREHKPFGLQLKGPTMHDAHVVAAGYAFEKATNYTKAVPPLF